MNLRVVLAAAFLVTLGAANAFAAKIARVDAESAELREGPGRKYRVLGSVVKGDYLTTSNQEIDGYYKVRAENGTVGWVSVESLDFRTEESQSAPSGGPSATPSPALAAVPPAVPPATTPPNGFATAPPTAPLAPDPSPSVAPGDLPIDPAEASLPDEPPSPPVPPAPSPAAPSAPPAPPGDSTSVTANPEEASEYLPEDEPEVIPVKIERPWRVRTFGGMNFFSPTEINQLLSVDLSNGIGIGFEGHYFISGRVAVVARVERIGQSAVTSSQIDISSFPLMAGVLYRFSDNEKTSLAFTLMEGFGFQTQVAGQVSAAALPNRTALASDSFSTYARFDYTVEIIRGVSIFGEAGYRLLKTASLVPGNPAVTGSAIFQKNGSFVPVSIDLSGPVVGAGIEFRL